MQIGLVGLGKMGSIIARRLVRVGYEVVGHDLDEHALAGLAASGGLGVGSLRELVETLDAPRTIWLMLPAGAPTHEVLIELAGLLDRQDVVIEGANSYFRDSQQHAQRYAEFGIGFLDVGVSGGIWGLDDGYGLLIGGETRFVERVRPVLEAVAAPGAFGHVGPSGAGHYTKMVHNAVEYGLMQAYAEGYELLGASEIEVDVEGVLEVWQRGCSVRSWLLDHLALAIRKNPELAGVRGWVSDSGMGRWSLEEAIRLAVPTPVMAAALLARFSSRQDESPALQAIAALREQIGGHEVTLRKDL